MKIKINMWESRHHFKVGNRVRLDVTSSAYPTFAPNCNTGKSIWTETEPIIAMQTVHHPKDFPSKLLLQETKNQAFAKKWMVNNWCMQT
jgi:uncharacterized protein